MKKLGILVVLFLALATPMAVADWTASDESDNSFTLLLAGGVGGPVGCISGAGPDDNGVLVVTLGSDINGSIGSTPASDSRTHANSPAIKQIWGGSPRQLAETCAFTVDECILGYGQSSLQNSDASLASVYSVDVYSIITLPFGTGPGGNLLSDTQTLNGSSSYISSKPPERWTTSITVPPEVNNVSGTVTTISQAAVYGWDCALQSRLTVTLAMDLSTPTP